MDISQGQNYEARSYDDARPEYPPDAVRWTLGDQSALSIVELGCGSGKLTRSLAPYAQDLIAIDPSPSMLAAARANIAALDTRIGTAEAVPVDSDLADVVISAQAWHWFDPVRASEEAFRVLRPAGRLGLMWNLPDRRVEYIDHLLSVASPSWPRVYDEATYARVGPQFVQHERCQISWSVNCTLSQILELLSTYSHVRSASGPERSRIMRECGSVLKGELKRTGLEFLSLRYITDCHTFHSTKE